MWYDKKLFGDITVRLFLIVALSFAVLGIAYYVPRILPQFFPYHIVSTPLDAYIPIVGWTTIIYLGAFIFWIVNYLLASTAEESKMRTFFIADFIIKMICMAIYILYPTWIDRPEITGTGFWDDVLRMIYSNDTSDNLLPSSHCMLSWMSFIGVRSLEKIPKSYKVFSLVFALSVWVSTVTTKQHFVIDGLVAIVLTEAVFQIVSYFMRRRAAEKAKMNQNSVV